MAAACSVIGEELAVYTVLISTVRKNTQELTGLWGNGNNFKSICSTTVVQPLVKCVYVCSLAAFLYMVNLCGLSTCTFELYCKLISLIHKVPINKPLLSIVVVGWSSRGLCVRSFTHICGNLENSNHGNKNSTLKAWHQNESCPGYECNSRVPISCHTHKCVMPQI